MKWQGAKYGRQQLEARKVVCREQWHGRFAFQPVAIPEAKYEGLVVPRHWVWLEWYAYRHARIDHRWERQTKSYAGEPSLGALARE